MTEKSSLNSFNKTKGVKNEALASFILMLIPCLYILFNTVSSVIAGRLLYFGTIGGVALTVASGGVFSVPFFGIINDISSNIFGTKKTKHLVQIGIISNIIVAVIFTLVNLWPAAPFATNTESYKTVCGTSVRVIIAGIIALFFSTMVNTVILQKMKKNQVSKGISTVDRKHIFSRAYISSIPSVLLDSALFNFLAFTFVMPVSQVVVMTILQVICKLAVEAVFSLPISTALMPKIVEITGVDHIDTGDDQSFNLFKL